MSSKGSLGNVCVFHTYLVVAQKKIQFSEELGTTQFIQEVINDKNGEFFFDGKFFEGTVMQEHRQLIKRANTSSGDQLDKQTQFFEVLWDCSASLLMKPFMKERLLYIVSDLEPYALV